MPDLLAGFNGLKRTASLQSDYTDEAHMKELDNLRLAKLNYHKANFNILEQFFRIFCRNRYVEHSYFLRADFKSFNKGIQKCYGGKENKALAELMYNYLGQGKKNHQITFSEFVALSCEFLLSPKNHNVVIFNMVSDREPTIRVLNLLRTFVSVPKGSPFADELSKILDFYVAKTLRPNPGLETMVIYNQLLYDSLIPYSVLGKELQHLFVDLPEHMFQPDGEPRPEFDAVDDEELKLR